MDARSVMLICGAALASGALAGCADVATGSTVAPHVRRVASASVVYQWGRVGGGLLGPGRAFGRIGVAEHRPRSAVLAAHRAEVNRRAILGVGPIRSQPTPVRGIHGTVTQVATSNSTGYALTSAGAVYAWGTGSQGELGDGSTTTLATVAVRVRFPAGVRIVRLANPMPYDGAIAIDARGDAWAWGNDEARNFCLPVGSVIDTPVRLPLRRVTLAAGAWRHSIYDAGGRVVSCGLSDHGQLGDGTIGPAADTGRPVAVKGLPPGRVVALTSAFGNAGVLMAGGEYYDWGINVAGQVGDGTTIERTTAVRVKLPAAVRTVFEGGSFPDNGQTIAILSNGQVWVWGANGSGQLGDGTTTAATRPVRLLAAAPGRFVTVSSGGATDYAIGRAGDLWAWGQGAEGEIGDGWLRHISTTPVAVPIDASQVSATARNVVALGHAE